MSLYQLNQSWSSSITRAGSSLEELHDSHGLIVIPASQHSKGWLSCGLISIIIIDELLAVGGLSGTLRLLKPTLSHYTASDTLLEVKLESPILQLAYGRFMGYAIRLIGGHTSFIKKSYRLCISYSTPAASLHCKHLL